MMHPESESSVRKEVRSSPLLMVKLSGLQDKPTTTDSTDYRSLPFRCLPVFIRFL